jgi:hypothetical protein
MLKKEGRSSHGTKIIKIEEYGIQQSKNAVKLKKKGLNGNCNQHLIRE